MLLLLNLLGKNSFYFALINLSLIEAKFGFILVYTLKFSQILTFKLKNNTIRFYIYGFMRISKKGQK